MEYYSSLYCLQLFIILKMFYLYFILLANGHASNTVFSTKIFWERSTHYLSFNVRGRVKVAFPVLPSGGRHLLVEFHLEDESAKQYLLKHVFRYSIQFKSFEFTYLIKYFQYHGSFLLKQSENKCIYHALLAQYSSFRSWYLSLGD